MTPPMPERKRANPDEAIYAAARSHVVGWLNSLHASVLAGIPSDDAAQLVDGIAWLIQEHVAIAPRPGQVERVREAGDALAAALRHEINGCSACRHDEECPDCTADAALDKWAALAPTPPRGQGEKP